MDTLLQHLHNRAEVSVAIAGMDRTIRSVFWSDPEHRRISGDRTTLPANVLLSTSTHASPAPTSPPAARMVNGRRASGTPAPAGTTSTGRGDRRTTASATEPSHHRRAPCRLCTDDDQIEVGGHSHQCVLRRTFFDHDVNARRTCCSAKTRSWSAVPARLCSRSASSASI